ncbi:MAG: hypothetical protein RLZZ214_1416 [Verrucomicrobiota bacterium]|jgi:hypothetical protein
MKTLSHLAAIAFTPVLCLAGPTDSKTTDATGQKFAERTPAKPLRVLLAGAGTSHDFPRFFLGTDAVTLKATGGIDVAATPNLDETLALLPQADVLVFSGNHDQYGQPAFQEALHAFADAGKGIVLLHAATWSHPWKGFNDRFVAGRTPSHGKGEFEVTITDTGHAVTAKIPAAFKITDENYRIQIPDGSKVHVCAENTPDGQPTANPSVWVVKDPKTRIVCITLGHAADAHDNPAFKTLLANAVKWVAVHREVPPDPNVGNSN